jgi:hypothetical protein
MRFEPTIPASERAKIVHALDREATVTGSIKRMPIVLLEFEVRYFSKVSRHYRAELVLACLKTST